MRYYQFADLIISMDCMYSYIEKMCRDYEVSKSDADISICVKEEDIEKEQQKTDQEYPKAYLETLSVYRKMGEQALDFDVLLMHASVVSVDGKAYLFTAPSGTGKSTHTNLWKNYFGDRAVIINDDKPLVRFFDKEIRAYGTPWDGKHGRSTNTSAVIQGVCILEQGKKNEIWKLPRQEALFGLLGQVYRVNNSSKMETTLSLLERFTKEIPVYKMKCDISEEAVLTAYQAMH